MCIIDLHEKTGSAHFRFFYFSRSNILRDVLLLTDLFLYPYYRQNGILLTPEVKDSYKVG